MIRSETRDHGKLLNNKEYNGKLAHENAVASSCAFIEDQATNPTHCIVDRSDQRR